MIDHYVVDACVIWDWFVNGVASMSFGEWCWTAAASAAVVWHCFACRRLLNRLKSLRPPRLCEKCR